MKTTKKIYITDLDGTFLNEKAELSEFSKSALREILTKDISFTVASARSVKSIQKIFKGIDLKLPIIEFNGAYISDLDSGEHLVINDISYENCKMISELFQERKLNFLLSTFNGKEDKLYYTKKGTLGENLYIDERISSDDKRLCLEKNQELHFNEKVVCFTCIDRKAKLEELFLYLKNFQDFELHLQENIYTPGWFWLTIHSHLATKDQAIRRIINDYGFRKENLTVFGDNTNDIKMFRYAGKSVAVSNAVDELKAEADEIIGSNGEDSVARYISQKIKSDN